MMHMIELRNVDKPLMQVVRQFLYSGSNSNIEPCKHSESFFHAKMRCLTSSLQNMLHSKILEF